MKKALIEIAEGGPKRYTALGKPVFVLGVPQMVSDEKVIAWAMNDGFLKVTLISGFEEKPKAKPKKKIVEKPVEPKFFEPEEKQTKAPKAKKLKTSKKAKKTYSK